MQRVKIGAVLVTAALLLSPLVVRTTYPMVEAKLSVKLRKLRPKPRPPQPAAPAPAPAPAAAPSASSTATAPSAPSSTGAPAIPASPTPSAVTGQDEKIFTVKSGELSYDFSQHQESTTTDDITAEVSGGKITLRSHGSLARLKTVFGLLDFGPTLQGLTTSMCLKAIREKSSPSATLMDTIPVCIRTGEGDLVAIAAEGTNAARYRVLSLLGKEGPGTIETTGSVARYDFAARSYGTESDALSYEAELFATVDNQISVRAEKKGMAIGSVYKPFDSVTSIECADALAAGSPGILLMPIGQEPWSLCVRTQDGYLVKIGAATGKGKDDASMKFHLWRAAGTSQAAVNPPAPDLPPPPPPPEAATTVPLKNGTISLKQDAFVDLGGMSLHTGNFESVFRKLPFDLLLTTRTISFTEKRYVRALGKPDFAGTAESIGMDFAIPWTSFADTTADVCKRAFELDRYNPTAHLTEHTDAVCFLSQAYGVLGKLGRAKAGIDNPSIDIEIWSGERPGAKREPTQTWEVRDAKLPLKGATTAYLDTATLTLHSSKDQPHDFGFAYDATADRMVVTDAVFPGKARLAFSTSTYRGPEYRPCLKALENPQAPGAEHDLPKASANEAKIFCFENNRGFVGALVHEKGTDTVVLWMWRKMVAPAPAQAPNACPYLPSPSGMENVAVCKNGMWGLRSCKEQGMVEMTAGMTCGAKETVGMNDQGQWQTCCASPAVSAEPGTASASASVSSMSSESLLSSLSSIASLSSESPSQSSVSSVSSASSELAMDATFALLMKLMGQAQPGLTLQQQELQALLDENAQLMGLVQAGTIDARLAQMTLAALQAKQSPAAAGVPVTSVLKTGDTSDTALQYRMETATTTTRVCKKKKFAGIKYKTVCQNVPQTVTSYGLTAAGGAKIASLSGTAFDALTEDQCRSVLQGTTGNTMPFPNASAVACVQFPDGSLGKAGNADAGGITVTRWPKAAVPNF